jgi:hypothetical protein
LFLRGVDIGAGRDPDRGSRSSAFAGGNTGNNVGSIQPDEFKTHTHTYTDPLLGVNGVVGQGGDPAQARQYPTVKAGTTGTSGGSETRPKNAYVNYIIKY